MRYLFQARGMNEKKCEVCDVRKCSTNMNCTVSSYMVHHGSGSCTPPAHKRLLSACALCAVFEVFTPSEFQQDELLLLIKNPFLDLVLGFGVVDREYRNKDCFQIVCTGASP